MNDLCSIESCTPTGSRMTDEVGNKAEGRTVYPEQQEVPPRKPWKGRTRTALRVKKLLLLLLLYLPMGGYAYYLPRPDWLILVAASMVLTSLFFLSHILHWSPDFYVEQKQEDRKADKAFLDHLMTGSPYRHKPLDHILAPAFDEESQEELPKVDILIPRYREPMGILAHTLYNAVRQDYDGTYHVWVLDDGKETECQQLAREMSCNYIARRGNEDAKAGNLNTLLVNRADWLQGEYFAVLDADMIAKPDYLHTLVAAFKARDPDGHLAFVQTPQEFRNYAVERDHLDMKNSVFNKIIMPSMSNLGTCPYVGTGALFKREALNSIGGFQRGSITEDILTAVALNQKGWRSEYVYRKLTFGLAPVSLGEAFDQRLRWVKGSVDLFFRRNPLCPSKMGCFSKIGYLHLCSYWLGMFVILYGLFLAIVRRFQVAYNQLVHGRACFSPYTQLEDLTKSTFIVYILLLMVAVWASFGIVTLRGVLRSFAMFVNWLPAYVFSFLSYLGVFKRISSTLLKGSKHPRVHPVVFLNYSLVTLYLIAIGADAYAFSSVWKNADEYCKVIHTVSLSLEAAIATSVFLPSFLALSVNESTTSEERLPLFDSEDDFQSDVSILEEEPDVIYSSKRRKPSNVRHSLFRQDGHFESNATGSSSPVQELSEGDLQETPRENQEL